MGEPNRASTEHQVAELLPLKVSESWGTAGSRDCASAVQCAGVCRGCVVGPHPCPHTLTSTCLLARVGSPSLVCARVFAYTCASCPEKVTAGGDRAARGDISPVPQDSGSQTVGPFTCALAALGVVSPFSTKTPAGQGRPEYWFWREVQTHMCVVLGKRATRRGGLGLGAQRIGQIGHVWSLSSLGRSLPLPRALSPFLGFVPQTSLSSFPYLLVALLGVGD